MNQQKMFVHGAGGAVTIMSHSVSGEDYSIEITHPALARRWVKVLTRRKWRRKGMGVQVYQRKPKKVTI